MRGSPVTLVLGGAAEVMRRGEDSPFLRALEPSDAVSPIFCAAGALQQDMSQRGHRLGTPRPRCLFEQPALLPKIAPGAFRIAMLDGQLQQSVGFGAAR